MKFSEAICQIQLVKKHLAGHGSILAHTCASLMTALLATKYFRKDLDMQNNSKHQTPDNTRAGGPDDTREMNTPNTVEEEQEVSTEEKEPAWR